MSLDLDLLLDQCKHCGRSSERLSFNCTYNCGSMWFKIYPDDEKMVPIDEMTGKESYYILKHAVDMLLANPEVFEALNPPNGWGSYKGFFEFISDMLLAAHKHPHGIWEACR
jgi:hypothetical protein